MFGRAETLEAKDVSVQRYTKHGENLCGVVYNKMFEMCFSRLRACYQFVRAAGRASPQHYRMRAGQQ